MFCIFEAAATNAATHSLLSMHALLMLLFASIIRHHWMPAKALLQSYWCFPGFPVNTSMHRPHWGAVHWDKWGDSKGISTFSAEEEILIMHTYLEHHSKNAYFWGSTKSTLAALHIAVGHMIQRIRTLCMVLGHDRHINRQMGQGSRLSEGSSSLVQISTQGQVSGVETKFKSRVKGIAQHVFVSLAELAPAFRATCTWKQWARCEINAHTIYLQGPT